MAIPQTVPQEAINFFQPGGGFSQNSPFYKDPQGYQWGMQPGDPVGDSVGDPRYFRVDTPGQSATPGNALTYYGQNGAQQNTWNVEAPGFWESAAVPLMILSGGMFAGLGGFGAAGAAGAEGAAGASAAGAMDPFAAMYDLGSSTAGLDFGGASLGGGAMDFTDLLGGGSDMFGNGAFLGEGAQSGIPLWDGALANAPVAGSMAAQLGSLAKQLGVTPQSLFNQLPKALGGGGTSDQGGLGGFGSLLPALLGGLAGAQGQQNSQTASKQMDPRMDAPVYGSIVPGVQNQLGIQQGTANTAGSQMMGAGGNMLGQTPAGNGFGTVGGNVAPNGYSQFASQPVTGNGYDAVRGQNPVAGNGYGYDGLKANTQNLYGSIPGQFNVAGNGYEGLKSNTQNQFGQVQMEHPNTPSNPYYTGLADDMQRRTQEMLGQNNQAIKGASLGMGGLGGSRQGVAEGAAAKGAADSLQGNLASLGSNMYNTDLGAAVSKYNTDTGFSTAQRGQDISQAGLNAGTYGQQRQLDQSRLGLAQDFGTAQRGQDLSQANMNQGFFGTQRGQDLQGLGLAGDLYSSQRQQDQNKYGLDMGNYNTNRQLDMTNQGQQMQFFGNQRQQDQAGQALGAGLMQQGINTQWDPLKNASSILSPFTGFGATTTSANTGGGLLGGIGGALGTAQLFNNLFK